MVFIMHVYRKAEMIRIRLLLLLVPFLLLVSFAGISQTSGIHIYSFAGNIDQGTLAVNARIGFELGTETRDALEQGVALEFDVIFRVSKQRQWLWDSVVAEKILTYRVEHQPLSGHYLVTELYNGKRQQFRTLISALEYMGKIESFPLIDTDMLSHRKQYTAQVRAELNIQSLPPPLRPLAYLSSQWHLASSWQNLDIQQ